MSELNPKMFNTLELVAGKYPLQNEYASFYERPDIRESVIKRNGMHSMLGLMIDLRDTVIGDGSGVRYVKTPSFLSQEITNVKNPFRFRTKKANASGTAGNPITIEIISPYNASGRYTVPVKGHQATTSIKGKQTTVYITNVNTTANGAFIATMQPINGETLDLTGGEYNWQYNTRIQYDKSCTSSIQTEGFVTTAPMVIEGHLQQYELGKHICDTEITNYGTEFIPKQAEYFDELTNQMVRTWCLKDAKMQQIKNEMLWGDLSDMLFGERDNVSKKGFDGWFATARKRGKMNLTINANNPTKVIDTLKYIAKVYKNEGITDVVMWEDQEMAMNVNAALAGLPGYNNFNLPIWSGSAQGNINWYDFKGITNFMGMGVNFQFKSIEGWEQLNMTDLYQNFMLPMPMISFSNSNGDRVPSVELVKLDYCDGFTTLPTNSPDASIWYDDTRVRGERMVNVYAKNSLGVEFHDAPFMGVISGGRKCF